MTYKQAKLKRHIETIGIMPFVLLGKMYGRLFPLKLSTQVFIFSPSSDIGGSVKVNADIAACLSSQNPLIIYSKKPKNKGHANLFDGLHQIDLHKKIDNKLFYFVNIFYRGVLASWINRCADPVVLGGESLYFYKVIPHLNKKTRILEICHLDTWFPYSIGFIDLIDRRIFSTLKLKQNAEQQYRANSLPEKYFNHLFFIENKIEISDYVETKNELLEVVFIGRGAPQKRVHLIASIAQRLFKAQVPVHFSFVGDVDKIINPTDYPYSTFYGNIRDEKVMAGIYQKSDVLILTSSYEGLPVVVMQMMAHGKIVLSTAVNAIPDYIVHLENGLLIKATNEDEIIQEGVELLEYIITNQNLRIQMGQRNRQVAVEKFNGSLFCKQYNMLIQK